MKKLLLFAAALAVLASCGGADAPHRRADHVILIALDGWGGYSIPELDPVEYPNITRMMADGCWTARKRAVLPSASAINWASMFMGVGTELHGYTTWGSRTPELPSRVVNDHGISPTVFSLMRETYPEAEIGVLYEWDGIKYLVDTLALSHHALAPDYAQNPEGLCEMAVGYVKAKRPDLLAVCFDQLDHAGHSAGHDTPGYYECLRRLDGYIGRIVGAAREAGIAERTVFMLTSDHGGIGTGHGGIALEEVETPFVVCGPGVKRGGEFEESMMQFDVAATMAYLLGLTPPQVWIGRPMSQCFE